MPLILHAEALGYLIADLDGTVCDVEHRRFLAHEAKAYARVHGAFNPALWDEFHARCLNDDPYQAEAELVRLWAAAGGLVAYFTARTDKYREHTNEWLRLHQLPVEGEALLYMRDNADYRPSHELKRVWLADLSTRGNIAFALDDKEDVIEMYRLCGLTAFHVRERVY